MKRSTKIVAGAVIALVVVVLVSWNARGNGGEEVVIAEIGDLVKTVELAGKVVPHREVDLAFEVGGTVDWVSKGVGDRVSSGEAIAGLDETKVAADLAKAEADLRASKAELSDSENDLVQNILDAYTKADDAIHYKVDQFFANGTSRNPEIINSFEGFDLRAQINRDRIFIEDLLNAWKADVAGLTMSTYTDGHRTRAASRLQSVSAFLNLVATAVNKFETNANLTQATIDKYRGDVATARSNINTAASSLISNVSAKAANISAAEATVANYRATLSKMTLRAPFSGVISRQDAKVGQAISANTVVASVISPDYKIEAYVPEVSFAGVAIGNKATVTLDAYGESVRFDATITHIDPRETIRDGVSTYKIELKLSKPDSRVRSGMTSNIYIETESKSGALVLPLRSILEIDGEKRVNILSAEGETEERTVTTGMTDSRGNVEIVSGLSEGESVLLNPKK